LGWIDFQESGSAPAEKKSTGSRITVQAETCDVCGKRVYALEKVQAGTFPSREALYHHASLP
jgi:hypothetical protein